MMKNRTCRCHGTSSGCGLRQGFGDRRFAGAGLVSSLTVACLALLAASGQPPASNLGLLTEPGVRPPVHGVFYGVPSPGARPGVLVLHGSGGLRPEYHTYASDLSRSGYVVLLVDLFVETGPVAVGSDRRLTSWTTWEETVRNAVSCLRQQPGVDGNRLGVVGFSRGAWLAFTTLGNAQDIRAIVDYYGVGTQPLDWQARGPAVLMLSGTDDTFADPAFVSRVAAGLRAAGRPAVRRATADAAERTRAFLEKFLRQ